MNYYKLRYQCFVFLGFCLTYAMFNYGKYVLISQMKKYFVLKIK